MISTSALAVARTYLGTEEIAGERSNPRIVEWLREVAPWASGDEVPWCGAFLNEVCTRLGLPKPQGVLALRARAWLAIGKPVPLHEARPEEDVVILSRGRGRQPGPEVIDAPGHVGWFVDHTPGQVHLLGGNQGDAVTIARFDTDTILGIRRLA